VVKDANINGHMVWDLAIDYAYYLSLGSEGCGGPSYIIWRLPNVKELLSLIDYGNFNPGLTRGHPFSDVQENNNYYTNTDYPVESTSTTRKCKVSLKQGFVSYATMSPSTSNFTWTVRGGN
jgi:hypothetical protein